MNRGRHLEPSPKPRTMQQVHRTLFYWCGGLESSLLSSYGGLLGVGGGRCCLDGIILIVFCILCVTRDPETSPPLMSRLQHGQELMRHPVCKGTHFLVVSLVLPATLTHILCSLKKNEWLAGWRHQCLLLLLPAIETKEAKVPIIAAALQYLQP